MDIPADEVETIAVSAFKPHSLALIERVVGVVLTRRGRPVAALVPMRELPVELWMRCMS